MTEIQKCAMALKAEIGRQLMARPLLGDAEHDDWWAHGGSINLEDCVVAVFRCLMKEPQAARRKRRPNVPKDYVFAGPFLSDETIPVGVPEWKACKTIRGIGGALTETFERVDPSQFSDGDVLEIHFSFHIR